jgi:hypothetical protein
LATPEEKACAVCGKRFKPRSEGAVLCGSKECRRERGKQISRKNYAFTKQTALAPAPVISVSAPVIPKESEKPGRQLRTRGGIDMLAWCNQVKRKPRDWSKSKMDWHNVNFTKVRGVRKWK